MYSLKFAVLRLSCWISELSLNLGLTMAIMDVLPWYLRRLPTVLRPRATWAQAWREILNPREVHAKRKNMASLFRNIVRLKFTKLLEFWLQ